MSDNNKKWCVYVHTNKINGKKYVGITSRKPEDRWDYGCGYRGQVYFYRAIQKYGWDNFRHEVLLTNETKEYACAAEKCLIKAYASNNPKYGYNLSSGGEGGAAGIPWSEERRKALSDKFKGRKLSDEWRAKISEAKTGTHLSEQTKQKLSEQKQGELNSFYGKQHSEETKKIISEKARQRDKSTFNTDGFKLGGVQSYTEESYKKLSESNRGENSGTAKLTEVDVIDILLMLKNGYFYSDIRKKYDISDTEISRIKNKVRWAYLYEKFPDLYNFPNIPKVKIKSNNTSGCMGVNQDKRRNKWTAYIIISGEYHYLGSFDDKDDAIKARLNSEWKYFGALAPQYYLFDLYNIKPLEDCYDNDT